MTEIKKGIYEHYSGKQYEVIEANAIHSETYEDTVVYKALYDCPKFGKNKIWCRPKKMFAEEVKIGETMTPRFKFIREITE